MKRGAWFVGGGLTVALLLPLLVVHAQTSTTLNARCVGSVYAPSTIYAGEKFSARVGVRNTSSIIWWRAAHVKTKPFVLGSQSPQDNMTWGLNRVPLPSSSLGRNVNTTFRFTPIAPTTPGTYPFSWQMLEEGNRWFGAICTKNVEVKLRPNNADSISISGVPSRVVTGQQFTVKITMRNNSRRTWTPGEYRLGSNGLGTSGATVQGPLRAYLHDPVAPNGRATFDLVVTAPSTVVGSSQLLTLKWKMLQENIEWFGETGLKYIRVYQGIAPTPSPIITPFVTPVIDPTPSVTPTPTQTQTVTITPNPYDGQIPTPTSNGYDGQTPYISALTVNITSPAENSSFSQGTQIPIAVSGNGTPTCGTWTLTKPNGETVTLTAADFTEGRLPGGIPSCISAYDAY